MRFILSTPVFVLVLLLQGHFFYGKTRESMPLYYISKTEVMPGLKTSEALFILRFHDDAGNIVANKQIKLSDNGVDKLVTPDAKGDAGLHVKPGKHRFQFFYSKDYFEITTDSIVIKPRNQATLEVYFQSSKYPVICDKPVIYLYPQQKMPVHVELDFKGTLGFTYPLYNKGWNMEADPDGILHAGGKTYNYLFWEGNTEIQASTVDLREGFMVKKDSLVSFFENKLSAMGLNAKETNDFITYWCPLMQKQDQYYIHFMFETEYSQYAKLTIEPKPDQLFRVFMLWAEVKSTGNVPLREQVIKPFTREGFTVVEWGGARVEKPAYTCRENL